MAGIARQQIENDDVRGALFRPDGPGPHPGVLVLGGSGGGVRAELATALAEHGLACLALVYFGGPGLPRQIVEVPLEHVETAARWLADRPEVTGPRVGVIGGSKGAELALLSAATFPGSIGPAVGIAPASVAFFGLDPYEDDPSARDHSSWSLGGRPLPFLPYPEGVEPLRTEAGLAVAPIYEAALANRDAAAEAAIPIERARGPVLLVSGQDDRVWPSERMGEMLDERMDDHGRSADVAHLVYPDAGHDLLDTPEPAPGVPLPSGGPAYDDGGTPEGDEGARADAWEKAGRLLREHLDGG